MLRLFRIPLAFSVLTICSLIVSGQDPRLASAAGDRYVISAKAGGVNLVEGSVSIKRADGRSGRLVHRDEIAIGEKISTGSDGRVEILLNPGSYLRVGPSTSIEFLSTSLDDLQLNMFRGNAMFEVIADDDFRISVKTPDTEIDLTRSGVYRFDVPGNGTAKVSVVRGKLFIGETKVKSGRSAVITGSGTTVAKFDRDTDDPLEMWSKTRAKTLAQTNAKLQRNALRNTLVNSFMSRGWNMYNSFGLWVFDPVRRMWCFLPFGSGWGSPYGYYYGLDTWNCGLPRWVYYQQPAQSTPPSSSSPSVPKDRPINNGDTHGRIQPPYQRIENSQRGSGDAVVNRRIGLPRADPDWNPQLPTSSPARSMPPAAPAAPAPPRISLPRGQTKEQP